MKINKEISISSESDYSSESEESYNSKSSESSEEDFDNIDILKDWYNRNIKLNTKEQLEIIRDYLVFNNIEKTKIYFSNDYEFEYYNLSRKQLDELFIRGESVFKLNILDISNKLTNYFGKTIIKTYFERKSKREQLLLTKKNCFIHDVYVKIYLKDEQEKCFDFGLEYFESIHNKILDFDKKIQSSFLLDYYNNYEEKTNNFPVFIEKYLIDTLTVICSLNLDPYTLAKINYFNENKELDKNTLEINTNIFNNIMDVHINKQFDLKRFFNDLLPHNPKNDEDFTYNEFITYLKKKLKINIEFTNKNICDYKFYDQIIIFLDINSSDFIIDYKKIYLESIKMIFISYNQIIKYVLSKNKFKNDIKSFMDNFIGNHLVNYNSKIHLENFNERLNNEKDFYINSITIYRNDSEDRKKNLLNFLEKKSNDKDIIINFD